MDDTEWAGEGGPWLVMARSWYATRPDTYLDTSWPSEARAEARADTLRKASPDYSTFFVVHEADL